MGTKKKGLVFTPLAERALATMTRHPGKKPNPDRFTVTEVNIGECWDTKDSKGFVIEWGTKSAGFGTLTVYKDKKTNKLGADMEAMGKRFCKEVLAKLIDLIEKSDS